MAQWVICPGNWTTRGLTVGLGTSCSALWCSSIQVLIACTACSCEQHQCCSDGHAYIEYTLFSRCMCCMLAMKLKHSQRGRLFSHPAASHGFNCMSMSAGEGAGWERSVPIEVLFSKKPRRGRQSCSRYHR